MLRPSIILFSVFLLVSCGTDVTVPCSDDDGPSGKLCREYLYVNDDPIGFAAYEHEADTVQIARFYNNNSELRKTLTEKYEDGKLHLRISQFESSETQVESWHYLPNDSLYGIVYGANDSSLMVTYADGKRYSNQYLINEELDRYEVYRYYQDDGELYRINSFNGDDELVYYRTFETFSTGQKRVAYFTAEHELIGRRVFVFSQLGLITSNEFTDSAGTVTEVENYIYNGVGRLIERTSTDDSQVAKSVFLYY